LDIADVLNYVIFVRNLEKCVPTYVIIFIFIYKFIVFTYLFRILKKKNVRLKKTN